LTLQQASGNMLAIHLTARLLKSGQRLRRKKIQRSIEKAVPGCRELLSGLELYDIYCFRAFVAFNYIKAHGIAFGQAFETIALDFGIVRKNIRPTVILGNETEPLGLIEPFYSSLCHSDFPPYLIN